MRSYSQYRTPLNMSWNIYFHNIKNSKKIINELTVNNNLTQYYNERFIGYYQQLMEHRDDFP